MGQFKPMVKMMTTEPSVELKLKKGGAVKKAMGGVLGKALKNAASGVVGASKGIIKSAMPAMKQGAMDGASPSAPSMASRRAAMKAGSGLIGRLRGGMKEGGETKATHKAEMTKMKGLEKELKSHEGKPASKAHKGLATGGVVLGNAGGYKKGGKVNYATGGVTMGNAGGFKDGGIIKSTSGKTKMVTAGKADKTNYATGGVTMGNAGGFKKGGASKKFAEGGSVQDDGRPQQMPQGNKPPSKPVSITRLSGSFKKGGKVKKMAGGGSESDYDPIIEREMARKGAEKASERAENEEMRDMVLGAPKRIYEGAKRLMGVGEGSVSDKEPKSITKTERSVTVTPGKKRGGKVC